MKYRDEYRLKYTKKPEEISQLHVDDIDSTINFLQTECKANEYLWISEVLEDVVEKAPSEKLVQSFKNLMGKFPEECAAYDIEGSIQGAEAILKWEAEHGKKD